MMTNMEVGKVDPLRLLIPVVPEVCMRAGKSAKKVGKRLIHKKFITRDYISRWHGAAAHSTTARAQGTN